MNQCLQLMQIRRKLRQVYHIHGTFIRIAKVLFNYFTSIQTLLSFGQRIYKPPELIKLPELYYEVYFNCRHKVCPACSKSNLTLGCICLICGGYVYQCCGDTVKKHTENCGIFTGLYFSFNSTFVYVYLNHIVSKMRSVKMLFVMRW